jgi:hypothetical protein
MLGVAEDRAERDATDRVGCHVGWQAQQQKAMWRSKRQSRHGSWEARRCDASDSAASYAYRIRGGGEERHQDAKADEQARRKGRCKQRLRWSADRWGEQVPASKAGKAKTTAVEAKAKTIAVGKSKDSRWQKQRQ